MPPLQGSNLSLNPFQELTPLAISCRPAGAPDIVLSCAFRAQKNIRLEFVWDLGFGISADGCQPVSGVCPGKRGDGRPLLLPEEVPYLRRTRIILKVRAPNSARIPSSPIKGTELPVAGNTAGTGSGAAAIMAELAGTLGWEIGAGLGADLAGMG